MNNKALYQQFCKQEKEMPVFVKPWYLDAVCQFENQSWDVILVKEQNKIVASWPFCLKQKNGFEYSVFAATNKIYGPLPHSRKTNCKTRS